MIAHHIHMCCLFSISPKIYSLYTATPPLQKKFLNMIINGKSQMLLPKFFLEGRGGCTQAKNL